MQKRQNYPTSAMLPNVTYNFPEDSLFGDTLLDLEYDTLRNLEILANDLKAVLIEEKMIMPFEFMVSHLCAYLGYLTGFSLKLEQATALEKDIVQLIQSQAQKCFALFNEYPVQIEEQAARSENLEYCRHKSPGTIIVQTIRLGRHLFDMSTELQVARDFHLGELAVKQTDFFCPAQQLLAIFKKRSTVTERERKKYDKNILLDINQTAIQIGYLMGYYGYMDGKVDRYLEYSLPLIHLFIEYGHKFSKMSQ